ncbi:peptidoglycan editing factor PgeF [Ammoniphilus sp. CFH 90114]|nr:peptidoglycan editing factor PgeF [Ammoniphilus sp. CFH 90114]
MDWEKQFPGLVAGFTTRKGGVSSFPFESMNCGLHVGDECQSVVENRKQLCSTLQFPFEGWTCADQVHGNQIAVVTKSESGRGRMSMEDAIPGTDGIVTLEEDVLLTSFYADCVPLLVIDPVQKVAGIAHAGWKGTAAIISQKIVETISNQLGAKKENLRVAIGPSIGGCCYEVDDRVINRLVENLSPGTKGDWLKDKGNGKYDVDLKLVNYYLFIQAGIPPEQIQVSSWCTRCRNDLFFSYRADGGKTGRMAAFLGWRK